MKLHPDRANGLVVTGLGPGWIAVNGERKFTHLMLDARAECQAWHTNPDHPWDQATMNALVARAPELVILGTGSAQRFAPPASLSALMAARVGFEAMDTAAACRTYNILAAEGRDVVALLVLPPPEGL